MLLDEGMGGRPPRRSSSRAYRRHQSVMRCRLSTTSGSGQKAALRGGGGGGGWVGGGGVEGGPSPREKPLSNTFHATDCTQAQDGSPQEGPRQLAAVRSHSPLTSKLRASTHRARKEAA